jgi:spore maturation protein CgeB
MAKSIVKQNQGKVILFLGADWWGSDARALAVSLRQRGHCLIEVKYEDYFPLKWSSFPLKVLRRIIRPWCAANYNEAVAQHLKNQAVDFVLVFKGMLLSAETLSAFQKRNVSLYCFYPDVSFGAHGSNIARCLPYYDCIFTTKLYHIQDERLRSRFKNLKLVSHGFDPEVHRPIPVSDGARQQYASDISFVGCWSPKKERLVNALVTSIPHARIKLWGPGWGRADEVVRKCWEGRGAYGDEMAIIYQCTKINLGLLSEEAVDTISGDQTTVRTWQIPAAGGFMLHEDTQEVRAALMDGVEVALFDGPDQLVAQARRFLADDKARQGFAEAACQRVKAEGYTYGGAAERIVNWHEEMESKRSKIRL